MTENRKKGKSSATEHFHIAISKDDLNSLPAEKFTGEIVLIDNPTEVENAISELEKSDIIGFDTETKPTFQKGQVNNVALLQLATKQKTFLIRICNIGLPERVIDLLENPKIKKVGLSLKDDFHNLSKICNINPAGFTDLQDYVKEFHFFDSSLTKIHGILFGKRISKNQQLTNWESASLTQKQKEYAALDAVVCINIYEYLKSGAFNPETSPYYKEVPCQKEN